MKDEVLEIEIKCSRCNNEILQSTLLVNLGDVDSKDFRGRWFICNKCHREIFVKAGK